MTLERFLLLYLIGHLLLCLLLYIGVRTRFFKFSEQLFPTVLLVPVFGVLMALIADYHARFRKSGIRPITLENPHLELEDLRLQQLEGETASQSVIPLEEAMSINDAETRRKLMLEILRQNPDEYIGLLQEARLDDDIEVTHYASTAIMEMQREYELSLQKAEKEYDEDPDSPERLERYRKSLQRYIDSGLIDENVLFVYRKRYADLLELWMRMEPEEMEPLLLAADNHLAIGNYTEARYLTDMLIERFPNDERAWFAQLRLCQTMNDGDGIRRIVGEIKTRHIYLTPSGRNTLAFWDREHEEGTADAENVPKI